MAIKKTLWLAKNILQSIRRKQKLFLHSGLNEVNQIKNKRDRNLIRKIMRLAKLNYHKHILL